MKILILSQPKCGSTAIYYKVKKAMPEGAKGMFEPLDLRQAALEMANEKNGLVKYLIKPWNEELDLKYYDVADVFDKIIILHRDPRDFMISAFLYSYYEAFTGRDIFAMSQTLFLLKAKEENPKKFSFLKMAMVKNCLERGDVISSDFENIRVLTDKFGNELDLRLHPLAAATNDADQINRLLSVDFSVSGFLNYVKNSCRALVEISRHFMASDSKVHWLSYADLVNDEFDLVDSYLGLKLATKTNIDEQHKRVIRTKGTGDWRNWITQSDIDYLRDMFRDYMETFSYPDEWEVATDPVIRPEHCSEYVYRLFEERYETRPEVNVCFSRETLNQLGKRQMLDEYDFPHLIPDFEPRNTEVIGSKKANIRDIQIRTDDGEVVNLLVPGKEYFYHYEVEFHEQVEGVSFWMMFTNQNGMPVMNGTSFDGNASHDVCFKGQTYSVIFPFNCDLRRGLYFCNAGITSCSGGINHDVYHRRVMTHCFLVTKPIPKKWISPSVSLCRH
jgi:hypothetical protein